MHMTDLIEKKKQGQTLTQEELHFIVHGYTAGDIPDYQMSALMMAIYFRGMTPEETAQLTIEMEHSGDVVDLSPLGEHTADKHSTGGVGDKTSLVLCPMVAACGGKMAKMSGRGLGHTGGTIDKLESFPGFSTAMTPEKFLENAENVGFVIAGQTANLAPADKKMYALRDVTATVDSIPLIVSSIMAKKLASGARTIVLDVKTGSGAFMETEESAFELARQMVSVGKHAGRNMAAVVTDMDQPLGFAVGNALEVKEAISVLRGAAIFMADLARQIQLPCEMDYMAVSSYGSGTKSSGVVRILKDLSSQIEGRHVIIAEDILDSGLTLKYLMGVLESRNPASIEIATLLRKRTDRQVDIDCRYVGFECPDEFIVGYGLDYAENYRNLPYIGILKPEIYQGK